MRSLHNIKHFIKYCASLWSISVCLLLSSSFAVADTPAGIVTFSIGKAYINEQAVLSGSEVFQGDVIETLQNGHVHIRFIDNGLVSVRPNSQLTVEHYQYNPETPADSVIKFDLNEGVMRSISGDGAKAARDKFRLNTPIAAIGVRGTDFVVKASQDLLQAVVNEGAIAVAPFSSSCNESDFGPCSGAVELDDKARQLLQITSLQKAPLLIPLSEESLSDAWLEQAKQEAQSESTNDSEDSSSDSSEDNSKNDATSDDSVNSSFDDTSQSDLSDYNKNSLFDDLKHEGLSDDEAVALIADNNASSNLPNIDMEEMAWGRFTGGTNLDSQPTLPFDKAIIQLGQAAEGKELVAVVPGGANGLPRLTALYRSKSELESLDTGLGEVNFNLNPSMSQANLFYFGDDGSSPEALTLGKGVLAIDFSNSTFNTNLKMLLEGHSDITYSNNGTIDSNGIFHVIDNPKSFGGGTTLDGEFATYMFYKDIEGLGTVEGITSWFNK